MKRLLVALLLSLSAMSAFALSTVEDVQAEIAKGNYAHAEQMMEEVVAAKPNSAKAHYIYAELLAHNRHFDLAATQAGLAKQLDPGIKFTDPEKFNSFTRLLDQERAAAKGNGASKSESSLSPAVRERAAASPAPASSGLPSWVWGAGIAVVALLAWKVISARRQMAPMGAGAGAAAYGNAGGPAGAAYGPGAGGFGNGYGQQGAQGMPGRGGGLLGTGMAVAGGVAAGMLAEKLLGGDHRDAGQSASSGVDSSGFTPGAFDRDDGAARDLEQRQVDFGSGDSWDSGNDFGGGGGSDDDSGGGW